MKETIEWVRHPDGGFRTFGLPSRWTEGAYACTGGLRRVFGFPENVRRLWWTITSEEREDAVEFAVCPDEHVDGRIGRVALALLDDFADGDHEESYLIDSLKLSWFEERGVKLLDRVYVTCKYEEVS